MEHQQVVGHAFQNPFATRPAQTAQQKLAEALRLFDLAEHRLHEHLSSGIDSSARKPCRKDTDQRQKGRETARFRRLSKAAKEGRN